MMMRVFQYISRFWNVYLTSFPGRYQEKKLAILRDFFMKSNQFLSSLGVDYWLAYGTLLGYHRENDLIPHDIDLDYGAKESAYHVILRNKHLLPKGVRLFDTSENHLGPKLYFSYKGFDADIYFYSESGDELIPFLKSSIPSDMLPVPKSYIEPLAKIKFLGQETFIPAEQKALLIHWYGYIGLNAVFDKRTGYFQPKK